MGLSLRTITAFHPPSPVLHGRVHHTSMKTIFVCICLISLVLGYPVPDSHSDSSQDVESDSRSSESSLRSSEQQYEKTVDHQTEDVSGGLHEGTVDQDHISVPTDSIDIEEQLTGIDDRNNQEDIKATHSRELQSSQEDKERESTDHHTGADADDEHDESGSLEDTLDNVTPDVSEGEGHPENDNKPSSEESHLEHDLRKTGSEPGDHTDFDDKHEDDDSEANDTDDEDQEGDSDDGKDAEDDDYEDNVSVKAGNSRETNEDCGYDDHENNNDKKHQHNFISQEYSFESNADNMQSDDSHTLMNSNSDLSINRDVTSTSLEKSKVTRNLKKAMQKPSKNPKGLKSKNSKIKQLSGSDMHNSKSGEERMLSAKHGGLQNRDSKKPSGLDTAFNHEQDYSRVHDSHSHDDFASKEELNSPEVHDSPEDPDSPEHHDSPEDPDSPEHHDSPEDPDSPEDHNSPEDPDSPEDHHSPEDPDSPEDHDSPEDPNSPENTESPEDTHSQEDTDSLKNTHSPEDVHSPEESPEDTHSSEDTHSPEDIHSPEDTNSPEDTHSKEDVHLKSGDKQSKGGASLSVEHSSPSKEDVTQSKESKEDTPKSVEDITDSDESVSKSKENTSALSHSESKETLLMKTDHKQSIEKGKSKSEEDDNHDKSTENKSESREGTQSTESSEDVSTNDSKFDDSDTTLEQVGSNESKEASKSNKSFELRSIVLVNNTMSDSKSSSKSAELTSASKEETEEEHDSSDTDSNNTTTAESAESQESNSNESDDKSVEVRHRSESSESEEDISRASISSEIDSRRLMFDFYNRKAIGNDNDCQDGY